MDLIGKSFGASDSAVQHVRYRGHTKPVFASDVEDYRKSLLCYDKIVSSQVAKGDCRQEQFSENLFGRISQIFSKCTGSNFPSCKEQVKVAQFVFRYNNRFPENRPESAFVTLELAGFQMQPFKADQMLAIGTICYPEKRIAFLRQKIDKKAKLIIIDIHDASTGRKSNNVELNRLSTGNLLDIKSRLRGFTEILDQIQYDKPRSPTEYAAYPTLISSEIFAIEKGLLSAN